MTEVSKSGAFENCKISDIMQEAYKEHQLIPAFNISYLEIVETITAFLKRRGVFGLVEVARPDVEKFGACSYKAVAEEFNKHADRRYCRLHLDHIPVIDEDGKLVDWRALFRECLAYGFDSVMIDGSRLFLGENIVNVHEAVQMAHAKDVPVEAELGAVMGHEAGPLPPYEELFATKKGFTAPEEAEEFVNRTGVDWLSVAVGSIHGALAGAARDEKKVEARLDLEHLAKLAAVTGIPLVLHGGSGIRVEYLIKAVAKGISKINVGTEIRQAYERGLRTDGVTAGQKNVVSYLEEIFEKYQDVLLVIPEN